MTRIRPIRKIGNSLFIKLNPSDIKDFQIKVTDEFDIEDIIKSKKVEKATQNETEL